jgi:hypothetical protein
LREDEHLLATVFDGSEQENHLDQLAAVVQDDILVWEVQQETRSDALQLARNDGLHLVPQVLQPVGLGLHL